MPEFASIVKYMFGFLLKIAIIAAVVGGVGYLIQSKKGSLPNLKLDLQNTLNNFDTRKVVANLTSSLDSLVLNPESKSPVALGAKISNESIGKVVDSLQSLPPDQISQIKTVLCAPITIPTPSVSPSPTLKPTLKSGIE